MFHDESPNTVVSDFFEECSICYSSETEGDIVKLACNHTFHLPCITRLVESSISNESAVCCVCRRVIHPEVLFLLRSYHNQTPSGIMTEHIQTLQEHVVQLRSDVCDHAQRIETAIAQGTRTEELLNTLKTSTESKLEVCSRHVTRLDQHMNQHVNRMEQQMVGLRHQVRVLEDVLSVRVNTTIEHQNNNPPTRRAAAPVTRSAAPVESSHQQQQTATTSSSVSAPSSVRRTGARSVMMRKWQRFRAQRSALYASRHPDLTRGAIQQLVRSDWGRMSREEKDAIQL